MSSSSEEDQSSAPRHRSSKPSGAQPSAALSDQDQPQTRSRPSYYREVALSDVPSQYAEEVDTFRCILSLPDPSESMLFFSGRGKPNFRGSRGLQDTFRTPSGAFFPSLIPVSLCRFSQVGGNRTSEAPGAVFDPTLGDEGVETPPPNDSLQPCLSPPVGGCLRSFRGDWQTNKCSNNVLNIITNGYILPFISKPSLVRFPLIQSEYKAHQKDQALATCIQSLMSKNAIERVENVKCLGFYSRLFLVPNPHQRWRPGIDLSRLNTFIHVEKFKMETPEFIRTSLIPGEWVSSIDLSDAYIHIPIHPNSRKYLRFCHRSQVFQFTSLPFGLATAPAGLYNDCKGSEADGPLQRT